MNIQKIRPDHCWYITVAFAAALSSGHAVADASAAFRFTGSASALESDSTRSEPDRELYREQHWIKGVCRGNQFKPQSHQVEYFDPGSDAPFAHKQLVYRSSDGSGGQSSQGPSLLRPAVEFVQPRFNERLSVSYNPQGVAIEWQSSAQEREQFRVDRNSNLVVDAGFDNLVRQNWQAVINGDSVKFEFLAPTRGRYYSFVMEPVESANNRDGMRADHVIQIRPDGFFLRLLVDPILLGYNQQGALTHYSGLTNIRLNKQENVQANIVYSVTEYPPCGLLAPKSTP